MATHDSKGRRGGVEIERAQNGLHWALEFLGKAAWAKADKLLGHAREAFLYYYYFILFFIQVRKGSSKSSGARDASWSKCTRGAIYVGKAEGADRDPLWDGLAQPQQWPRRCQMREKKEEETEKKEEKEEEGDTDPPEHDVHRE